MIKGNNILTNNLIKDIIRLKLTIKNILII